MPGEDTMQAPILVVGAGIGGLTRERLGRPIYDDIVYS